MIWRLLFLLIVLPLPALGDARANMDLCRAAAIRAADAAGIPREVMLAITLVETRTNRGGESGPWPWTVNVRGRGFWFDSRAAALLHAQRTLAAGETSFDSGCFQLNFRWHGGAFTTLDEMFEPSISGAYAAKFLKSLHDETGDWIKASGMYHSRLERHAHRYRTLVSRAVAGMNGAPVPDPPRVAAAPVRTGTGTRTAPTGLLRRGAGALIAGKRRGQAAPASAGGVALVILGARGPGLLGRSRPARNTVNNKTTGSDG